MIAPPSFAFALSRILSGYVGGLPGVHAMWAGADLTWHQPIPRDTKITAAAHLKDLVEHQTRFAGRAFQQIYHVELSDQQTGAMLVSGDSWCFRTERDAARERGSKYTEQKAAGKTQYSDEDLRAVYDLYEKEVIRGAEPRYYEDVEVGEQLPVMGKGPMTVTGFIAFAQGWGGLYIRANKIAYKLIKQHPGTGDQERIRYPGRPGARPLGGRTGHRRRHARGVRLRPGAMLLAHPAPDELDGRRRISHPSPDADPPP